MKKLLSAVIMGCLLLNPVFCFASEETTENQCQVKVSDTEVGMDKETGEFSFEVTVDTEDAFAGMEFGVICSEGCEITAVTYNVDAQTTLPTKGEGVIWFGFFDGEDSYTEDIVATINGKCEPQKEAAVALQVVKRYTVGEEDYTEEQIPVDIVINVKTSVNPLINLIESEEGTDMNVGFIIAVCIVAGVLVIIIAAFIYKKVKQRKGNEETTR